MRITGLVAHGKQLGRTLGFPMVNVAPDGGATPQAANGVWIGRITLSDGVPRPCMVNQGHHPTVPDGPPTIEAHILDYDGDVYGERVTLEYLRFLRPERRFDGVDALKAQLTRDREAVRAYFTDAAREKT